MTTDDDKARLRESVLEAAKQGIRSKRPSRKNPHYESDPQFRLMLDVVGPCRATMERLRRDAVQPDDILKGCLDEQMRSRNLDHIRDFRDFLSTTTEPAASLAMVI